MISRVTCNVSLFRTTDNKLNYVIVIELEFTVIKAMKLSHITQNLLHNIM